MKKVFIIAEAGVNHNGSLATAKKMIDLALEAGVDAIKFQTFTTENLVTKSAGKANYQKGTTANDESQFSMLKNLELDQPAHKELLLHCEKRGIMFLSSPFDLDSVDFLNTLGIPIMKIPSGEITNLPYLRKIGRFGKKIILSTGMACLGEIEAAIDILVSAGTPIEFITILHCNTEYPTPMQDVNLLAMQTIKRAFPGVAVGYSDHTTGIEISIAATALGAEIIEKHFTLDRSLPGPDHEASVESNELGEMVRAIRNIEVALGSGIKKPSPSERKNINIARKSIVAACNIKKGEIFNEKSITVKRPGDGLSPIFWDEVIGRKATKSFRADELIELS